MSVATDLRQARSLQATGKGGERKAEVHGLLDTAVAGHVHRDDGAAGPDCDHLDSGASRLDLRLFTEYPASSPAAGARPAILGSIWVIATTAVLAIPLGVAAAVQLEEFADKTKRVNHLIEVNVQNLAAIPSVVYGLLALAVLTLVGVQNKNLVIAGATALGLLILPVIIIATREALRSVPAEIREGSLALGATPLQTMWRQTLPSAVPGIATGRSWRCRGHWARRRLSSCSGIGVRQLRRTDC